MPSLHLGDTAPEFEQDSSEGPIQFHPRLGDSWGVLFSHPADFTPVCTTEADHHLSHQHGAQLRRDFAGDRLAAADRTPQCGHARALPAPDPSAQLQRSNTLPGFITL